MKLAERSVLAANEGNVAGTQIAKRSHEVHSGRVCTEYAAVPRVGCASCAAHTRRPPEGRSACGRKASCNHTRGPREPDALPRTACAPGAGAWARGRKATTERAGMDGASRAPMTRYPVVEKTRFAVPPNLVDYDAEAQRFTWDDARDELDGLPGGGLNIAHEAVDRHARGPLADHVALRWLGKDGERPRHHVPRARASARTASRTRCGRSASARATASSCSAAAIPELYVACLGTLKNGERLLAALLGVRSRADRGARRRSARARCSSRPRRSTRRRSRPIRDRLPSLRHVIVVGRRRRTKRRARSTARRCSPPRARRFEIPPTDPEDIALLHFTSGTTGKPKGAVHVHGAVVAHHATGQARARPPPGRRLLVHRRSRLGHRHVVRHHRAAHARRDEHRRRGRLRRRALVRDPARPARHRLVHGADRRPHADARRGRAGARATISPTLRFVASVGEPLNPEAVVLGHRGARAADPRQLVADGDGRDHDRELRVDGHPAGLDGAAAARRRGRDRATRGRRRRRRDRTTPNVEGELALRPGWPSMFRGYLARRGALREVLRGRLVPDRRPRAARRGRLLLVRRPRRRRHQVVRAPHRSVRGRERAARAPGRRRGRRHRQARSGRAGDRQGVRRRSSPASRRATRSRSELLGFARKRLGRGGRAEGDRVRRGAAADAQRQDHAPPAQGARARPARRRHLDAGERRHDRT